MTLLAGSVSVADDGTVTKSGAAGRLFDLLQVDAAVAFAVFGQVPPVGPDSVASGRGQARLATTIAGWLVTEMTAHAVVRIPAALGGLQLTPTPNDPGTPTVASGADVDLAIL